MTEARATQQHTDGRPWSSAVGIASGARALARTAPLLAQPSGPTPGTRPSRRPTADHERARCNFGRGLKNRRRILRCRRRARESQTPEPCPRTGQETGACSAVRRHPGRAVWAADAYLLGNGSEPSRARTHRWPVPLRRTPTAVDWYDVCYSGENHDARQSEQVSRLAPALPAKYGNNGTPASVCS